MGKINPVIIWQFIVFKHNEHQIPEIKKLAKQYKVDKLELKSAQIYDFEEGSALMPTTSEFSRYKKDETGKFVLKSKMENKCWKMWHSTVVTWDGNIVPCCFDKDAKYQLGNLENENFVEIWQGKKYHLFREKLFNNRKAIDICQNCSEGLN